MDLDGLKVIHAGLDQAEADLMDVVNAIDARLGRLDAELAPLSASWAGEAQAAYAAAQARWRAAVVEMRDHLRLTSLQVGQSNAEYRAADARGARAFEL